MKTDFQECKSINLPLEYIFVQQSRKNSYNIFTVFIYFFLEGGGGGWAFNLITMTGNGHNLGYGEVQTESSEKI